MKSNRGREMTRLLRKRKGWQDPTGQSPRRLAVFPAESELFLEPFLIIQ
jgi:hypothetical protein